MSKGALAVVILAAGQGMRMRSERPKVLHEAAGRPLVEHVIRAVLPLAPERIVVVVGRGAERVKARLQGYPVGFVTQAKQLGTGHALLETEPTLGDFSAVMALNGDGPLLRSKTLGALAQKQRESGAGMTLLTCEVSDPRGLGRIIRDEDGSVARVVEEKDASDIERRIREINPGIYVFSEDVFTLAKGLSNDNAAGEYYITDLVSLYLRSGRSVQAVLSHDETEVLGVNDRRHLAIVDRILRDRIRDRWLREGVTMISPEQVYIDDTVVLEPDVSLYPGVWLKGETVVRRGAVIGPYAYLENCEVAEGAIVAPHTVQRDETV